jgi:PAS domain S-box-containing protein
MTAETMIVLTVGDDSNSQQILTDLLESCTARKFHLQIERSFDDAQRSMLSAVYDVCFIDSRIAGNRGLELVSRTIAARSDAALIVLSEADDYKLDIAAMDAGAVGFLVLSQLTIPSLERAIRYGIERKQCETNFQQSQQRTAQLAAIVDGSEYAMMSGLFDGTITSWNEGAHSLYGYSEDEMVGQSFEKLVPDDRKAEHKDLLRRVTQGEKLKSYETVRLTKDGTFVDISLSISPVRDLDGKIIGHSAIACDIRQRKLYESQIQRQVMRIQALRNIDMAITGSLDLRVTLNVLLDQVTTHLKVDSAAVLLLNPHTHRLQFATGRGFRTNMLRGTDMRLGEGIAGKAALEKKVIDISNINDPEQGFARLSLVQNEDFISYWAAPLITKGRVEGILELYHRSELVCDDEWVAFLETLAGQAAIAIENADLFNDLQKSNTELQLAYDRTLEGWSKALDLRDKETEGHTQRVTEGAMRLARALNVSDSDLVQIRRGGLLHDIGKMGIPDSILLKPGPLTQEEWAIMRQHPVYAYELVAPISYLRPALDIPYCHHEKWDGTGYPRGLVGDQIPLAARIFAVVDVCDALTSDRPYRKAWPKNKVHEYILEASGTHFDPHVVEVFLSGDYTFCC